MVVVQPPTVCLPLEIIEKKKIELALPFAFVAWSTRLCVQRVCTETAWLSHNGHVAFIRPPPKNIFLLFAVRCARINYYYGPLLFVLMQQPLHRHSYSNCAIYRFITRAAANRKKTLMQQTPCTSYTKLVFD